MVCGRADDNSFSCILSLIRLINKCGDTCNMKRVNFGAFAEVAKMRLVALQYATCSHVATHVWLNGISGNLMLRSLTKIYANIPFLIKITEI
jgi:hypothetical protein